MSQEHDGVETGAPADEGVVALDGQVERDDSGDGNEFEGDDDPEDGASGEGDEEDEAGTTLAAEVKRDPSMTLGTTRDHILSALKRTKVWPKLGEREQVNVANEVEQACRQVIRQSVRVAAAMDLDAIDITISKPTLTDKRQIEAKIGCPYDPKTWAALPEFGKRLLVFADADALMGARAVAVQKDQPGLFDMGETAQQRAEREAIDAEAAEHEASVARARQIQPLNPPTLDNDTGDQVEDAPPPALTVAPAIPAEMTSAERVAYKRGQAHRLHGGARTLPGDLVAKDAAGDSAEANAFLAGWNAEPIEPEVAPAPEAPKKRRGRKSVEASVAERQAAVAGADARGTYQTA